MNRSALFSSLIVSLLLLSNPKATATPIIVIDPGHGGQKTAGSIDTRSNSSSNNARTPGGLLEKDLTLEFSKILEAEIHRQAKDAGYQVGVLLTRYEDINLDFIERAKICHREDTACVVSIHFNATGGSAKALGSLALIAAEDRNPSFELDSHFGNGLAEACSQGIQNYIPESKSRGVITDGHLHGGLGSNFYFQMLRYPRLREVPKCFLEVEFIDNPVVEEKLLSGNRAEKFRTVAKPVAAFLLEVAQSKTVGIQAPAAEEKAHQKGEVSPPPVGYTNEQEQEREKRPFQPFKNLFKPKN